MDYMKLSIITLIILIIIMIVVMICSMKTKENFGSLARRRILSKAYLDDQPVEDNQVEQKEKYEPVRDTRIFKGQYSYLTDRNDPTRYENTRYDTTGTNVKVSENDDVITNSGNALIPTTEGFGLTRLNNNFNLIETDSKASKIAQSEDDANDLKIIPRKI